MKRWIVSLGLVACSPGTAYLVVLDGTATDGPPSTPQASGQTPVVTSTPAPPEPGADETVIWNVDFRSVTEVAVTEVIVVIGSSDAPAGTITFPVDEDDRLAGVVEIPMSATTDPPEGEGCRRDDRGMISGFCAVPVTERTTEVGLAVSDGAGSSGFAVHAIEVGLIADDEPVLTGDCYPSPIGTCAVEACCNAGAQECWYEYGGSRYPCDGLDCDAVAQQLVAMCAP